MKRLLSVAFLSVCLFVGVQAQTTYYVNDSSTAGDGLTSAVGDDANTGGSADPFETLAHALSVASPNDVIMVDAGTYAINSTLDVNKSITIEGLDEASVVFDATGLSPVSSRAIETDADNVSLRNFTVLPAIDPGPGKAGFTIKAGSNSVPNIDLNLTLENITVDGAERTPFDIHGIDGVVLSGLTANNTSGGNGIQLSGVHNAIIDNFSGTNNAWGAIAIYTSRPFDRGSDNITIDGASLSIDGAVYAQNDLGALNPSFSTDLFNTNVEVTGYGYNVFNDDFRSAGDGPEYTFFYETQADAVAGGAALNTQNGGNTASVILELGTGLWIAGGTGYSIQAAIDAANPGETVSVLNGTYNERLTINKSIALVGESETGVIVDGSGFPNGRGIEITSGTTDVIIEDLTVQNFSGSNGNTHAGIYAVGGNDFLIIQDVTIQNNIGGSGFYANGPVTDVLIDSVTSSGHSAPVARGIVIWNGLKSNITITNCEVFNNNCCGIELQDGSATGVTITNNLIYDNADNGLGLTGMTGPGANIVANNILENNGRFGIEVKNPDGSGADSGAGSIVVENNDVSRTTAITDLRDIVGIAAFRRAVLAGNVDIPTGVVIRNNTVSGYTQSSDSDGFGIVVEGTNHTVTGNSVNGCDVGIQQQSGHTPYPGDGNQNNIPDDYFGRGNSPVTCGNDVSANTFSSNGIDERSVGAIGGGIVTNVNTGAEYCSIQAAIDAATAGDVISVSAGTYDENVTVSTAVTLNGPNAGEDCSTRSAAEAIIAPSSGVPVTITADGVTLDGFEITAPDAYYAVTLSNRSDVTVAYNRIHNIGTNLTGGGNIHAIINQLGSSNSSNVAIQNNCIETIGSSNLSGFSLSAIGILQSVSTGVLTDLDISGNVISDLNVNTAPWPAGKIAYGIIINVGSSGFTTSTGKVVNATISGNSISNLEGFISTGIGLEGNTENAVVSNNFVEDLTGYKTANRAGGGYDLQALKFESNRYVSTVTVENNSFNPDSFTHDGTSGRGYAVVNYVTVADGGAANLTCNWLGSDQLADIEDNAALEGYLLSKVDCQIDFPSILTDNTDDSPATGFQPAAGACINVIEGCTHDLACNYDATATFDDGSCDYDCYGCTDPGSADLDPAATEEDGSCDLCPTDNAFDDPVVLSATQAPGVWYTDRYAPAGFDAPVNFDGGNRLRQLILSLDGADSRPGSFSSSFYDTQGRKYDLPEGVTNMSIELYIPSDWATTGRRMAGFWGSGVNAGGSVSAFPIIEFSSDENGTGSPKPRFRGWDATGWFDIGLPAGFAYDSWVTLEIQHTPDGEFLYRINDLTAMTQGYSTSGTVEIANVILQGHNTTAGVTYSIHWDNFSHAIVPNGCTDSAACNYDPAATCDDGSCEFTTCAGCTDPLALNYDGPTTTIDDGSCTYPAPSYTNLSVEEYAVDGVTGYTTYRVFANFDNQYDELTTVYGVVDGNETSPLSITTTGDFYQDSNGGLTADDINPALFATFPSLEFDSYLAIGAATTPSPVSTVGIAPGDFDANGLVINDNIGGLWFVTPGAEPEATAGPDGKVLIGQFTTNGIVDMTVNLQYRAQDGSVNTVQQEFISFPDDIFGCTDDTACNYNPLATADDNSCTYPGCLDDDACNYDPSAGCTGPCDYTCLTAWYVNDTDATGDVYTTGLGDDANPGTDDEPFRTLAYAVSQATPGDTIYVDAGTYEENVLVDKALDIRGSNYGISPNGGTRNAESVVYTLADGITSSIIVDVAASDVSVRGFTFDGDNPALTSGFLGTNGADLNAMTAVSIYTNNVNNLNTSENIMRNFSYFAMFLYGADFNAPATSGHVVNDNLFEDLGTYDSASGIAFWGGGLLLYNDQYAAITNNVMNNVRLGVQTGNFGNVNPGTAASQVIENNQIAARRLGIFHNLFYSNASEYTIANNTFTGVDDPNDTQVEAVSVCSMSVPTTVSDNTIDLSAISTATTIGYEVWNTDAAVPVVISGGTVSNVDYGLWANNFEGYNSNGSDGAHADVSAVDFSINAGGIGIYVLDSPNYTGAAVSPVVVNVSNSFVDGGDYSVKIEGETCEASIDGNSLTGAAELAIDANSNTNPTASQATCNWFGTSDFNTADALVEGNVDNVSILTDGTDTDSVAQGFQGDLGTCTTVVTGCTDGNACNYTTGSNTDDGSCDYSCYGCTDSTASNYDSAATIDDGSCDLCSTNEDFDSALTLEDNQTPGAWYVDRYEPAAFTAPTAFDGDDRLRHLIFEFDGGQYRPGGLSGAFYNTQGRKYDLPEVATAMQVELYVPSDWATTGRRMAGFWGTAFDASDAVSGYPIIEFTSDSAGTDQPQPRFRAYDNGVWIDMGLPTGFTYDSWVTLEMRLVPSTGEFIYEVGDLDAATTALSGTSSVRIANVILQGHNTEAGVTYTIHWDNFEFSIVPNGCTDMAACNYDPAATCNDGSCIYPDGCTDETACNYDSSALCDDGSCEFVTCTGCTDPLADNYDAGNIYEDGSCTYCPATTTFNTTGPDPIFIGSGLSNNHMAVSENCNVSASIKAHERFLGDIIPTGNLYRIESGESPTSGAPGAPADPGTARWNYLWSVNLGSFTADQVQIYLDIDFDPAVAPGTVYTADVTQFLIDNGQGGLSLIQDSQNLGFGFWQMLGDPAILPFDPTANGLYDLTLRIESVNGDELANAPIQVEVFTPGCTDSSASNYNSNANEDDGSCLFPGCTDMSACNYDSNANDDDGSCTYATTWYADTDGDGFGDASNTTDACTQPAGFVADNTDCDDSDNTIYPGAPPTAQGVDNNCNGTIDPDEEIPCPGDFNNDGLRNSSDLLLLLAEFGCNSGCQTDLSGDGSVGTADLIDFLPIFGTNCP
jgi:hypothetical protein